MEIDASFLTGILVILATIVSAFLAYYFNEKAKRKWTLAREMWKLKYDSLKDVLIELWEMGNVVGLTIFIMKKVEKTDDFKENLEETATIWQFVNERYLEGRASLRNDLRDISDNDFENLSKAREEVVDFLQTAFIEIQFDISEPLAGLRLLVKDQTILDMTYSTIDQMKRMNGLDDSWGGSFDDARSKLDEMVHEISGKARSELEGTRKGET